MARAIGQRLAPATGPVTLLLPLGGIEQWDRPGEPLHDPVGLAAFIDEMRRAVPPTVRLVEVHAHINDDAFADAALAVFDAWVAAGRIAPGVTA